jgi:predicted nucleic acid-binding protein
MKFWDASAVVPLLVAEPATSSVQRILTDDPVVLVWWGTAVECASALARLEREGALKEEAGDAAFERLKLFETAWHEVEASEAVRETALRFLRVHPLRSADALQLAAAFVASERRPPSLEIVTLDDRLMAAARKEGFRLAGIASQ